MLDLTQLLRIPRVDVGFDISPDGKRLAFAWNKTGEWHIYEAKLDSSFDPQENYERWYNASPYFFLNRINAPVQLICGGTDPRCPASDSSDARDKLVELGKNVELLLV